MIAAILYALIALVIGAILYFARRGGADAVKANIGEQNAKTAERIADAHTDAPANLSELRERLRDGGKL